MERFQKNQYISQRNVDNTLNTEERGFGTLTEGIKERF